MREQVFYADAIGQRAKARADGRWRRREKLTRLMGLAGRDSNVLAAEQLPALPAGLTVLADVEPYAVAERLDFARCVFTSGVERNRSS